jgi:hypothetical protein
MDSVPRIQGAFAPLFLEEWGHIRGASVDYLWRGLDGSRWISEAMYGCTYIHSFMCVCVSSSEYTYVCKHAHRSARTFTHTSTSPSANRHPSAYHAPTYPSPSSMTVEIAARLTLWLSAGRLRASHFPWQPCARWAYVQG